MKECSKCKKLKNLNNFSKQGSKSDGLSSWCRECVLDGMSIYLRTKKGLVKKIISSQKQSSKMRGHNPPAYSRQELKDWLYSQKLFHELYDKYKQNGYKRLLVPSIDRIDDYKPYTMDNITLTTWNKNKNRGHTDRKNGINNKVNKAVLQIDKYNGTIIETYHSQHEAMRKTGISNMCISSVCLGKNKTAGGYVWKFKELAVEIINKKND